MIVPEYKDVNEAHLRIKEFIHKTPVLTSKNIDELAGSNLFFKCENFQKVGAFKFRGATNAVLQLTDAEARKGVATHSSGNHAQALALAAKMRGIQATIVMPDNSPKVKIAAVKGYEANVVFCEPTLAARESTLNEVVKDSGSVFIHPYNNFNVIAGQGTACLELANELPGLDYIVAPVGGGGLLSGTILARNGASPTTKIIAAEPEGASDAFKSLIAGKIVPSINPKTIADGLLTSLGEMTFEIIVKNVETIVTVNDEEIIESMRLIWERMKIIVEPSSATVLAAVLKNKVLFAGKRVGLILSGGNVDLERLPWQ